MLTIYTTVKVNQLIELNLRDNREAALPSCSLE